MKWKFSSSLKIRYHHFFRIELNEYPSALQFWLCCLHHLFPYLFLFTCLRMGEINLNFLLCFYFFLYFHFLNVATIVLGAYVYLSLFFVVIYTLYNDKVTFFLYFLGQKSTSSNRRITIHVVCFLCFLNAGSVIRNPVSGYLHTSI